MNFLPFLLFALGFVLIIKGSDFFLDSIVWIARKAKVSDLVIGSTLVSVCTTLPETVVSVTSSIEGNADVALSNALGSIACNVGLILGLCILLSPPRIFDKPRLTKNGVILLGLLIFVWICLYALGMVSRWVGVLLLVGLALYMIDNIRSKSAVLDAPPPEGKLPKNLVFLVIGLAGILIGAKLVVDNGTVIARFFHVPDMIIGLTLTAFGTSLPELVTSLMSIVKKTPEVGIGNIIGASILNNLLVTAASATIFPINMSAKPIWWTYHLPMIFLICGACILFVFLSKKKLHRWNGLVLLMTYAVYIGLSLWRFHA